VTGAVTRFRVMAVVVGIALFVLVVSLVVKYGYGRERFAEVYSPIHGYLYIGYLATVADLARRAGWSLLRTVGVMLAGTVPVLSFVVERRTTRDLRAAT
jgi:integral membrane protein